MAQARRYGLLSERDVYRFINFLYLLGADFATNERLSWMTVILERRDLAASEKLDLVKLRLFPPSPGTDDHV